MPVLYEKEAGDIMAQQNDGEVLYEIRSDDSKLDSDLAVAEKKVEQSAEDTAQKVERTSRETSSEIKKETEKVSEHHKKSNKEQVQDDSSSAGKRKSVIREVAEYAKKSASDSASTAKKKAGEIAETVKHPGETARKTADSIKKKVSDVVSDVEKDVEAGGKKVVDAVFHPVETAKEAGKSIVGHVQETGEKVGNIAQKTAEIAEDVAVPVVKTIGAVSAAVGAATVAAGAAAVTGAVNMDQAMNQYIASTGKSVEETKRYQDVLESVYKNNYGESFEDIANAMAQIDKNLGEMSDEQLQQVTESAFALRDVFEYDVAESTRAAKAMMDNFGVSGEEAMSMIAAGAQNGLDYSGELLDSISEYSVQFAKVGLDANDMFQIFQSGAESGAWNLDKIGDAVKEFAIRAIDGSDTTKAGFEGIGLSADEMAAKFGEGGEAAREAFQQTVQALASVEDPLARDAAGVALFGTMWEDLGPEVVAALADIENGAYDTAGAMDEIKNVKYNDLGSMLAGLKRNVEMLLIPIGEELIPVLGELIEDILPVLEDTISPLLDLVMEGIEGMLPLVEDLLPVLLDLFSDLMPVFQQILGDVLPVIIDLLGEILPILTDIISEVLPVLIDLFTTLGEPLMELISALLPPLLDMVDSLLPVFEAVIQLLDPLIEAFTGLLGPIVSLISEAVTPLIEIIGVLINAAIDPLQAAIGILASVFAERLGGILTTAQKIIGDVIRVFQGIIDFVAGIFTGDWERAWNGVVKIFDGIISGLADIFKIPINWIIDGINGFLEGINGIKIPDWVPVVGGKGFDISLIPRLKKGADFIPSDYFPAYLDYGERVLTQQENRIYTALGGLEGMVGLPPRGLNMQQDDTEKNGAAIDYEKLGQATADAFARTGLKIEYKGRELGRVVREELDL